MAAHQPLIVDARGMKCPWPLLRLARAARGGGGGHYLLLADDPAVPADLDTMARQRGWTVAADGDGWLVGVPNAATES
jgi:tRNA 2-thiouridine synthesizing protein A